MNTWENDKAREDWRTYWDYPDPNRYYVTGKWRIKTIDSKKKK